MKCIALKIKCRGGGGDKLVFEARRAAHVFIIIYCKNRALSQKIYNFTAVTLNAFSVTKLL